MRGHAKQARNPRRSCGQAESDHPTPHLLGGRLGGGSLGRGLLGGGLLVLRLLAGGQRAWGAAVSAGASLLQHCGQARAGARGWPAARALTSSLELSSSEEEAAFLAAGLAAAAAALAAGFFAGASSSSELLSSLELSCEGRARGR